MKKYIYIYEKPTKKWAFWTVVSACSSIMHDTGSLFYELSKSVEQVLVQNAVADISDGFQF